MTETAGHLVCRRAAPLILASASPRRRALLAQIGIAAEVEPAAVDETVRPGESPAAYVERIAAAKAAAVVRRRGAEVLVLAADTVVVAGGEILGKPASEAEAGALLARLGGRTHDVLTALCVRRGTRQAGRVASSRVTFAPLRPDEIAAYVATGEGDDKAGAYAIQGRAAMFVTHLAGSYSTVVGLPLYETRCLLAEFGCDPLLDRGGMII